MTSELAPLTSRDSAADYQRSSRCPRRVPWASYRP